MLDSDLDQCWNLTETTMYLLNQSPQNHTVVRWKALGTVYMAVLAYRLSSVPSVKHYKVAYYWGVF